VLDGCPVGERTLLCSRTRSAIRSVSSSSRLPSNQEAVLAGHSAQRPDLHVARRFAAIPSAQMTGTWDEDEARLEERARQVRDRLGIDAALQRLGPVHLVGSAALHLMVARDVDLVVVVPRLDAGHTG
jgi:hypothetical protein